MSLVEHDYFNAPRRKPGKARPTSGMQPKENLHKACAPPAGSSCRSLAVMCRPVGERLGREEGLQSGSGRWAGTGTAREKKSGEDLG